MKEKLFISYANENADKVKLITNELREHPIFEPIVVANKREPNKALVKKVSEGIDSSYRFIPILSVQSFKTQWINQEIGYAVCRNIPIVPIVQREVLSDLKGFIHKQNDCPYTYAMKIGLFRKDENISFLNCFKDLIQDLEIEYKAEKKKTTTEIVREANSSLILSPPPQPHNSSFLNFKKPLGTIARTGELCPEEGIWKTQEKPTTSIQFIKNIKMPGIQGRPMIWKLVSYN
jgi:hypothetical protein